MEVFRQPSPVNLLLVWGLSLLAHLVFLGGVQFIPRRSTPVYNKVSVSVVEKAKPLSPSEPSAEPQATKPAKPPEPKPKDKKIPVPDPAQVKTPAAQPVMGLNKDSFAEGGKGSFAAPAGNTTMMEDDGRRLSPEQIRKLDRDLSEDAKLVPGSYIKPEYTTEAEDSGLEGTFVIEIYVDAKGQVTDAELRTKIGYGMDERVLNAARKARFSPRKNPLGQAQAGWTELRVRLTLE